jgi:hypothetical protein
MIVHETAGLDDRSIEDMQMARVSGIVRCGGIKGVKQRAGVTGLGKQASIGTKTI